MIWQALALAGLNKALNYPQEKRHADFQATKNKWAPYMDTSKMSIAPQQGLVQNLLGLYGDSLVPAGREKLMGMSKTIQSDLEGLLGGDNQPTFNPDGSIRR